MRAVFAAEAGGPEVLEVREVDDPVAGPGQVVIEVAASAVNRADLMQRMGFYPPPPGASDVLGLECAGTIASIGAGVTRWQPGDRVCALLAGGGYAEQVAVPAGQVLPVPDHVGLVDTAGLPEVVCTVWSNVFMTAGLQRGELLLVHGGAGGIGTMAIQLATAFGARVACTVGSAAKATYCTDLGADLAINYHDADYVEEVRRFSPDGADVILDNMGAAYLGRNLDTLSMDGRLVVIGMQGGATGELDLRKLMGKRASVTAAGLRARNEEDKSAIVASVEENVWPLVAAGTVKPIVHERIPLDDVTRAHQLVGESSHIGKVLITA